MTRFIRTPRGAVLILVVAVLAAEVWAAGVLTLPVRTVSAGGGSSSAGGFELTGTIGQPLAGRLSGGNYVLHGGMWHPVMGAISPVVEELPGVPARSRLNAPYPNPFNPSTNVSFDLALPGPVRVRIYDFRGRLVRELVNENMPAGRHEVLWDGKTNTGGGAPSGVFFLHFETAGSSETRKMTLLK